jgi:hypothetical protein
LKSRQWISAIQRAGEGSNWEMTVKNGFGGFWVREQLNPDLNGQRQRNFRAQKSPDLRPGFVI